jgi:hypothetical protein
MRSRLVLLGTVLFVPAFTPLAVAEPPKVDWTGRLKWAEKYPKAYPAVGKSKGGVEVLGSYEVPEGWVAQEVQFDYFPKGGGILKTDKTVKLVSGQWGVLDNKTKKAIPAKIPLDKGVWSVRIVVWYAPAKAAGQLVEVVTSWENIEVK